MQKHIKLETGDHAGGGRRRASASPVPPVMQRASHVHLIRRGDFGHVLCVRRAPYRRCPPQNGDEKLRPASNRCWAEFCDSSRAGAAAFSLAPARLPFRSRSYVPAATVQPFSRGLRGLARAPRLEPGAHMVVQAAERLHHRPRQQAEHDEDERALQIELLQAEERREAEIRDHEQHAEHDDHHLADGVVRLARAVHHHEADNAHDAGADRDHGRVVELEGDIKQQNAHDHRQIRHRGRQRAEEHVAQEFSLDEALVRLHGEDERRDADGNGAHERELRGAERVRQRGKEREKRE